MQHGCSDPFATSLCWGIVPWCRQPLGPWRAWGGGSGAPALPAHQQPLPVQCRPSHQLGVILLRPPEPELGWSGRSGASGLSQGRYFGLGWFRCCTPTHNTVYFSPSRFQCQPELWMLHGTLTTALPKPPNCFPPLPLSSGGWKEGNTCVGSTCIHSER